MRSLNDLRTTNWENRGQFTYLTHQHTILAEMVQIEHEWNDKRKQRYTNSYQKVTRICAGFT